MLRNHPIRLWLMLILLTIVVLSSAQARGATSLHVLFTGGANANLEPSG